MGSFGWVQEDERNLKARRVEYRFVAHELL